MAILLSAFYDRATFGLRRRIKDQIPGVTLFHIISFICDFITGKQEKHVMGRRLDKPRGKR